MAWERWQTGTPERRLLSIGLSTVWIALLWGAAHFLDLNEPYLPFAIAGGLIFYLRNMPPVKEQIVWVLSSAAFSVLVRFPHTDNWIITASSVLALGGFAGFLMLGLRWIWSEGASRRQNFALIAPAAAMVFFVFSAQRALSFANILYPKTYDLYLYIVDGSFGFQPSFTAGQAMAGSHLLRIACLVSYLSLPFVMALVYALRVPRNSEHASWDVITLLMAAGIGGWALYNVLPATGPVYVFGSAFPWQSLSYHSLSKLFLEKIPVSPDAPRNAIPSLHMAWVVLLFWSSRGFSRALRMFLGVYLALTVISTLGTGEHYFVDLVAGLPFALFIWALVSPGINVTWLRRALTTATGLGMTLGWLLLVRFAARAMLVSPILPWTLVAVTIAGVWILKATYGSTANSSSPSLLPNEVPQVRANAAGARI